MYYLLNYILFVPPSLLCKSIKWAEGSAFGKPVQAANCVTTELNQLRRKQFSANLQGLYFNSRCSSLQAELCKSYLVSLYRYFPACIYSHFAWRSNTVILLANSKNQSLLIPTCNNQNLKQEQLAFPKNTTAPLPQHKFKQEKWECQNMHKLVAIFEVFFETEKYLWVVYKAMVQFSY